MKVRTVSFVVLLIAILAAACAPASTPAPAPTAPPPTAEPPAPAPTVSTDPTWDKVIATGRIVFGSSIDYPPYESYDQSYQPTGFDIAVAREIGTRLGFQVDILDIPFEGLLPAVQTNQVDAAIAAISITPERQQTVDFSSIYYTDQTAALARQGSGIKISAPNQLANYRVGVQRGTVYEQWVKKTLIDPGLMPADKLFAYEKPEHAVRDLKQNYVDVVVMGKLAAQEYVNAGGVELSGESLNPQLFGIAMSKGAPTLRMKVNEALTQMQNDGTLARFADQYLGAVVSTQPLPTVPPSNATQPPTVVCDSMSFVADLTIPDGSKMNPGENFNKVWRIKNSGSCTWNNSYKFVFVQGDAMGGQNQSIKGSVAAGQTYDMSISMTAPKKPGKYTGQWQMVNGQGVPFGTRVWVQIEVRGSSSGGGSNPTAVPPSIEYFNGPSSVNQGDVISLSWAFSTQDLVSAKLNRTNPDGSVTALYGGDDVTTPGSYDDLAAEPGDYTYTLAVSTEFGGTQTATVNVTVQ